MTIFCDSIAQDKAKGNKEVYRMIFNPVIAGGQPLHIQSQIILEYRFHQAQKPEHLFEEWLMDELRYQK